MTSRREFLGAGPLGGDTIALRTESPLGRDAI
jgi:hypothetical protein